MKFNRDKLATDIFFTLIFMLFLAFLVSNISFVEYEDIKIVKYKPIEDDPIWDVPELKKDLEKRIFGQSYMINELTNIMNYYVQEDIGQRYQLIFFIGGPGVGKSYVNRIMKNHIKCEDEANNCYTSLRFDPDLNNSIHNIYDINFNIIYKKQNRNIIYINDEFKSLKYLLNDNKLVNYYKNHTEFILNNYQSNDYVHTISGEILTQEEIEKFKSYNEYKFAIEIFASNLDLYLHTHAPRLKVHIVAFNPLSVNDVKLGILNQYDDCTPIIEDDTISFVPLGCKVKTLCRPSNPNKILLIDEDN
jgi:hypothetical protein